MAQSFNSIRFSAEPVRSLSSGSISAGYVGVGTSVGDPIRQFFIQNLTDATLMFSFDGINDHFPLPANGFFLNDIASNKLNSTQGWYLAEGTRLYVKEIGTPSTGAVYFSVFYGSI
jgi:hypothetical protein